MKKEEFYTFQNYEFKLKDLDYETYEDGWHKGIIFYVNGDKFDICYNKIDWTRILINRENGAFVDLPFNDKTIALLPAIIKVRKIND